MNSLIMFEDRSRNYTENVLKDISANISLSEYDAAILTEEKEFSDYFEKVIGGGVKFKSAANWMLGPVKSWQNENNEEIGRFPVTPEKLAGVIKMVEDGKLSFSIASTKLFNELLKDPQKEPVQNCRRKELVT